MEFDCEGRNESKPYSEIAQARPNPSYVEVPRPSSSIIMREFSVADYQRNSKRIKLN